MPGCERPILAKRLCRVHYGRDYRKRNPERFARYNVGRRKPQRQAVCEQCGEIFLTALAVQRFCGWDCAHKWHRRRSDQKWNDRRRANYQKRRAQKRAAVAERILLEEIRQRDRDRCGLCGGRVRDKPYPHPLSPSVDHVVPLSEGGAHTAANVQLAHLRCNLQKGARGGGEQLRLV
jgi:5-methylcytosine-specific restriction endonuclease McrA